MISLLVQRIAPKLCDKWDICEHALLRIVVEVSVSERSREFEAGVRKLELSGNRCRTRISVSVTITRK